MSNKNNKNQRHNINSKSKNPACLFFFVFFQVSHIINGSDAATERWHQRPCWSWGRRRIKVSQIHRRLWARRREDATSRRRTNTPTIHVPQIYSSSPPGDSVHSVTSGGISKLCKEATQRGPDSQPLSSRLYRRTWWLGVSPGQVPRLYRHPADG